jgi:hypothetical protein
MQLIMKRSAIAVFVLVSIGASARGSRSIKAGSEAAGVAPTVKAEDLRWYEGKKATQYRPDGLEIGEAELQELDSVEKAISKKAADLKQTNELHIFRGQTELKGDNDDEMVADKTKKLKGIRDDLTELEKRRARLQLNADARLKKYKDEVLRSDSEVLDKISDKFKNGKETTTLTKDEAAAIIGRFRMLGLEGDIRSFLLRTKDAKRDLEALEMKLDQSILGTYVAMKTANLVHSKSFCAAVKQFKDGDCASADPDFSAPLGPDSVNQFLEERRKNGHK